MSSAGVKLVTSNYAVLHLTSPFDMSKQAAKYWPEAVAFVTMIEERMNLSTSELMTKLAGQPGWTVDRAHQVRRWKAGRGRPDFTNAMELLYAAGMVERPRLDERAAAGVLERAAEELAARQSRQQSRTRGQRPA